MKKQTSVRDNLGNLASQVVEVPGENTNNEWCETVDDDIYNNL